MCALVEMSDMAMAFGSLDSALLFGYDYNCDPCNIRKDEVEEAIGFCNNCKEYLCRECYHVHCIPTPSEDHITVLLSAENRKSSSTDRDSFVDLTTENSTDTCTDMCPDHEGRVVRYYCPLHKEVGCKKCMKAKHTLCKDSQNICIASENLDSNQIEEFRDKVKTVRKSAKQMFRTAHQHIDTTESNHEKVLKEVDHFKQDIIDWAEQLTENVIQMAEANKNENIDRLTEISAKYDDATKSLEDINDNIEALQTDNKKCKLFVYMTKAEKEVQSIQDNLTEINAENRTTLYKFKPNRDIIQREADLGSLQEKEKLGHYWVNQTDHLEAIYIRSGKDKYNRVSKRNSRRSVKGLATHAFKNEDGLDMITEGNELGDD